MRRESSKNSGVLASRAMPRAQAEFIVTLVVSSAIGLGVTRHWLAELGVPADDAALARYVEALSNWLPVPDPAG